MEPSLWLNTLLEKHAGTPAGLVWMQGASQSADVGVYNDTPPSESEPRPTISLFEHWEEGAHLPVAINARDYSFPSSLIYSSVYDGGHLLPEFEENGQETATVGETEIGHFRLDRRVSTLPLRIHGQEMKPRSQETLQGLQKRKPYPHRRPGNRWDQYGESSSAASSEAHITSDKVQSESTWGPLESASRDKRAAQPYRLQKSNKSDGQWSRWAGDIRRSQPDQWSDSSSKWLSSAGDNSSWKKVSEWDGSQWSAATRRTLKGSDYETDRDWHSRNMRYGDGWAYDSTQSHYKRAKPTWTDPEDDRKADLSLPIGSTSKTYDPQKDHTLWQRKDSRQEWWQSSSSMGQWKPRL